jgi:signal transduction histidine kinase
LAKTHGVTFQEESPRNPIWVYGDSMRLRQVLTNLLSNAAKFSHSGGTVEVSLSTRGGKGIVSVTDHGVGIPDTFRGKIFQKFTQADSSDSRNRGGTGLGLAICRAIIDHHFGDIEFASVPGDGASFSFSLPLMEQPHPSVLRRRPEEQPKNSIMDAKGP